MGSPPTEPTDNGTVDRPVEIDDRRLYRIIRNAVEDAIRGVLGTLLLLGTAAFFLLLGGNMLLVGSPPGIAFGGVFLSFGLYIGAATFELIPTVGESVDGV